MMWILKFNPWASRHIGQLTTFTMTKEATRSPRRVAPFRNTAKKQNSTMTSRQNVQAPPPRVSTPPFTVPVPSDTMRFSEFGKDNLLHPVLLQTITEDLKFDHMMPVQSATLHDLLEKRIDCLAQAKTGTGKTIAFLLPAIQTLINRDRQKNSGISLLVISPTRELAMQIAKAATALLQRLPKYKVCFAIGGTSKDREEKDILNGCDILIATPGRLYDHLGFQGIRDAFGNLDTLVLDEADRLLDMGFMNALKDIIQYLPDKKLSNRQGMLFSATIAPHVQKFAHLVLSDGYKFISTIPKGEVNTHERVPQLLVTVPNFADVAPAVVSALRSECALIGKDAFKVIIFAPTAALADWYGAILGEFVDLPNIGVLHSRVSQNKRTKITNAFRDAESAILVATDVVARGMDFPNVSSVFQIGLPADKESYIHRLGRTARAGRDGRSVFILTSNESFFARYTLKEIKFEIADPDLSLRDEVQEAASNFENKGRVYQAWLGYYKNHVKAMGWDNVRLVTEANRFAIEALGAGGVPSLEKTIVGKMGLKGVKGLNVVPNAPRLTRGGGGEGRLSGASSRGKGDGSGHRGGQEEDAGSRGVRRKGFLT
jgi:ATP-dependent RNA helicase MSS116, mitochondrial